MYDVGMGADASGPLRDTGCGSADIVIALNCWCIGDGAQPRAWWVTVLLLAQLRLFPAGW
jgi:hypothetical protein